MICYPGGVLPVARLLLPYGPGAVAGTGRAPEAVSERVARLWVLPNYGCSGTSGNAADVASAAELVLPQGSRRVGRARTAVASYRATSQGERR